MTILEALILGLIQGLTEFLPVSSSGHLELARFFFGSGELPEEGLYFTVLVHFATALATIVVFRKEILKIFSGLFSSKGDQERTFSIKILISMVPAAAVGLFFEDILNSLFSANVSFVGFMLLITGLLLLFSDRKKESGKKLSYFDSALIGLAQAVAILPGISRSGATLATSILLGIKREEALQFSFLMVIPLILGKMAKDMLGGSFWESSMEPLVLIVGFSAAFISGYFACRWMISLVKNARLRYFAYYCFGIGMIGIVAG
jgi:undecaprenyl-diphosphatase